MLLLLVERNSQFDLYILQESMFYYFVQTAGNNKPGNNKPGNNKQRANKYIYY